MKTVFLIGIICVALAAGGVTKNTGETDLGTFLAKNENRDLLEDLLMDIINSFRTIIENGLPCLGIPPLDPLVVPDFKLNITSPLLRAASELNNVKAEGLGSYNATRVKANLLLLTIDIAFDIPAFNVSGEYDIQGMAAVIFPIFGKGPFTINVGGIATGGKAKLVVAFGSGQLSIKNLDFVFGLGELDIKFEGLLGGGDLGDTLNEIVNTFGLKVFEIVENLLHDILVSSMETFINKALDGITLGDIIGGGGRTPLSDIPGC